MCEPFRRISWRSVPRSTVCRRRSSSSSSGVRRPGARSARHRISSTSRLPRPASRSWSMRRALSGAARTRRSVLVASAAARSRRVTVSASGPSRSTSGAISTRPEAPGVVEQELATVAEGDAGPHPLLVEDAGPVLQPVERLAPVDHEPAGHAEAHTEGGATLGVEQQELAAPAGRAEGAADQGRPQPLGRGATPAVARVDHPHPGDLAVQTPLGQLPVELDFEDLGHRRTVSDPRRVAE